MGDVKKILDDLHNVFIFARSLDMIQNTCLYKDLLSRRDNEYLLCNIPTKRECKDIDLRSIIIINVVTDMIIGNIESISNNINCDKKELQTYIDLCNMYTELGINDIYEIILNIVSKYDSCKKLSVELIGLHFIANIQPKLYKLKNKLITVVNNTKSYNNKIGERF